MPDKHSPKYWAVVPAAGAGKRMGAELPKQYLPLGDRTVLEQTLDTLLDCPRLSGLVLALSRDDEHWPAIEPRYATAPLQRVAGGAERCHSVLNSLDHLAAHTDANDWVLVHDAARPCVRIEDIDRLIATLETGEQGGLLGVPVADTMKRVDGQQAVTATVDRDDLWHAYTPQMFRLGELRAALRAAIAAGKTVTDEANAMELAGFSPRMVQGSRDNIKITLPADLALAAFYLQTRSTP